MMYDINRENDYLLVQLHNDFNYPLIETIIRHETALEDYHHKNDIWLIGEHHADIRLSELEKMVKQFEHHCPAEAKRRKTAVVIQPGLTHAIFELWAKALKKRVTFEIEMFQTLEEAKQWIDIPEEKVA